MPTKVDHVRNAMVMAAYTAKAFCAKYPAAPLTVIERQPGQFDFVVDDPFYTEPKKLAEFHNSIRPVTAMITLTSTRPTDGTTVELEDLLSLVGEMSLVHTVASLENALSLRHPELEIKCLQQDAETLALTVVLPESKQDFDVTELNRDLIALPFEDGGATIIYRDDPADKPHMVTTDNVFGIVRSSARSNLRHLRHLIEDDERWYPRFGAAASGELQINEFPFAPDNQRTIFVSSGELLNLPNLRNYFLLYDRVLLEVPLLAHYLDFEDRHRLTADDLAEAAAQGRLRLLVTQPEERLPVRLLEAVQERVGASIISRRAGSIFAMAAYANRALTLQNAIKDRKLIRAIGDASARTLNLDRATVERVLLEPISSYHQAMEALRHNDLKALPHDLGRDAWNLMRTAASVPSNVDLELEFVIGGNMIQVATLFGAELALGGTTSPFALPANAVSTAFALFGGPLSPMLAKADHENDEKNPLMVYPEGPIFDFSERRRLSELLALAGAGADAAIAHSIFSDLARLSPEERGGRILEINDVVAELGARPSAKFIGEGMPTRYADIIIHGIGLFIPLLGHIAGGFQMVDELIAWYRDIAHIKALGADTATSRRQVELLSRVRKVAWLSER